MTTNLLSMDTCKTSKTNLSIQVYQCHILPQTKKPMIEKINVCTPYFEFNVKQVEIRIMHYTVTRMLVIKKRVKFECKKSDLSFMVSLNITLVQNTTKIIRKTPVDSDGIFMFLITKTTNW